MKHIIILISHVLVIILTIINIINEAGNLHVNMGVIITLVGWDIYYVIYLIKKEKNKPLTPKETIEKFKNIKLP